MQSNLNKFEGESADEFEKDDSAAKLCEIPRIRRKADKLVLTIVGDLIDKVKRDGARKISALQDSDRRSTESNRFDVNRYAGGPATIPDLCLVERRKVR